MIRRESTTQYDFDKLEIPIMDGTKIKSVVTGLFVKRVDTEPVHDPGDDPIWFDHGFEGYACKADGSRDKRSGRAHLWWHGSVAFAAILETLQALGPNVEHRQEFIEFYTQELEDAFAQETEDIKELLDSLK
jgi:hypothetical protein